MDGLDLLAVGKAQQPFAGPVDGGERVRYSWPFQQVLRRELVAEWFRQGGHRREIGGAAVVGPCGGVPLTVACFALAIASTIALSSSDVRAQALSPLVNRSNLAPPISSDTSVPSLSG